MKTIKINFVDFWSNFDYKKFIIYQILSKKYKIEISDNPDYLFFSCFGYNHLKYNDCIKIFYTGENVIPNFNQCDYAIGFHYIEFEDRYLRYPLFLAFENYLELSKMADIKHLNKNNYKIRNKFCNMVVSNNSCEYRNNFFLKLSKYKKVDSGGGYLNNIGGPVTSKLDFQKSYKFSIAFENSSTNGYTTEKIIDAFAAGGIPIYWGDPLIDKIFNPKAFINAKKFKSDQELIDYIKKIDNDEKLYKSYIKEPVFIDKNYLKKEEKKLEKFLNNIFDKDILNCKKENYLYRVDEEKIILNLGNKLYKFIKPIINLKSKFK